MSLLWGCKTDAWFDVWTIEHILSGLSIGTLVKAYHNRLFERILGKNHGIHSWHFNLAGVLCLGFAWETVEHYLESGLMGTGVAYWLQGVEFWANRLITDPLMMVLGYAVANRFPHWVVPARAFSIAWLVTHVFLFPHSMYLHEIFREPGLTLAQGLACALPGLLACGYSALYLSRLASANAPAAPGSRTMPPGNTLLPSARPADS